MNADSAGYVARDLTKVGVESSNLFARSNFLLKMSNSQAPAP